METDVGVDGISFLPRFEEALLDHHKAIGSQEDGIMDTVELCSGK